MNKPAAQITKDELRVITTAIWNRYGIDFRNYENTSLCRRVSRLIDRFDLDSVYALWRKFLYEQDFIQVFIDEITVGLTELFRNPGMWAFLGKNFLKPLPSDHSLHIWHAGCSTGEEVYSLLITLIEYKRLNQSKIIATDLSHEALQAAQAGIYDHSLWAKYNENYCEFSELKRDLGTYTQNLEQGFQMNKDLRNRIIFSLHNLVRDPIPANLDWIFCRNVLIYFDDKLKLDVLKKFYEALKPGGLFIMGFYDYIAFPQEYFKLAYPDYKIFIRNP